LAKLLTPTVAKIELNQFEHVFFPNGDLALGGSALDGRKFQY
jgi:hypothetical protein